MTTNRITWETSEFGSQLGYVLGENANYKVKALLFTISYGVTSADSGKYVLKHRLPFQQISRRFGDVRQAQKHAERYLVLAMDLLGFKPKEDDDADV